MDPEAKIAGETLQSMMQRVSRQKKQLEQNYGYDYELRAVSDDAMSKSSEVKIF